MIINNLFSLVTKLTLNILYENKLQNTINILTD